MNWDEIYKEIAGARDYSSRYARIGIGQHTLELVEFKNVTTAQGSFLVAADFIVVTSTTHQVGDKVSMAYLMNNHKKAWQRDQALSRAKALFLALGTPFLPSDFSTKSEEEKEKIVLAIGKELVHPEQHARGVRVSAYGQDTSKEPGKVFVEVTFTGITGQTATTIRANRAAQESGS